MSGPGTYLPAHVRVLTSDIVPGNVTPSFRSDPRAGARIRAVKRQFEALRPARMSTSGHPDGDELDTDRAVRAHVDFRATGQTDDRIWQQTRPQKRDLAVSILLDVSRSTESAVPGHGHGGRSVIDIEREALAALSWGLDACGDDFAIHAFSSLKRDRVYVQMRQGFRRADERHGGGPHRRAEARLLYEARCRDPPCLGRSCREQGRKRRLLLVITDGKPNDLDHYEGRHGIEDSRKAVLEARRAGSRGVRHHRRPGRQVVVSAHVRAGRLRPHSGSGQADPGLARDLPAAGGRLSRPQPFDQE